MRKLINYILITLGALTFVIFAVFTAERLMNGYWQTKVLFAKEINDSTGCYVRIDKHFKVYYIEDGNYSKFKLFIDRVPTNTEAYSSLCDDKYDMVETILRFYYSRNDAPKFYPEYKPCKQ